MADQLNGLLDAVKTYLLITWLDPATDTRVIGYIKRGMACLQQIAGAPLDFTVEDLPRSLLLDYCRYANSQALEVFEQNFQSELLDLNLRTQAPIIDPLVLLTAPRATPGIVFLTMSPAPREGNLYVYRVGTGLALPGRMDACAPPDFMLWDGFTGIVAASGQEILVVEVSDEFSASRAGKVTVS